MIRIAVAAGALLLASCGEKMLTLPEEPVDRAATCGVVATAEARLATAEIKEALAFDAAGHILHYPLLAGAAGESFSSETAAAVQRRMSELQGEIGAGKWQALIPACEAAFPIAEADEATLPADRFEAQLGCDELAQYMIAALKGQGSEYGNEVAEFRALRFELNRVLGPGLTARAGESLGAQQDERAKALAAIARAGQPTEVLKQCISRFG